GLTPPLNPPTQPPPIQPKPYLYTRSANRPSPHYPAAMLAAIAAMSENRVIGRDGQLPWRLRDDLAHFKRTTMGRVMILGRKTFDETGKPLPGRISVVITRDTGWARPEFPEVHVAHSVPEAIELASRLTAERLGPEAVNDPDRCPIVIGGGIIYQETLPQTQILDLTRVHATVDGDTFFPELGTGAWVEASRIDFEADERNQFPFSVVRYRRNAATSPR
ncbi:MAG: dihydrofolate reductase, partial [Phycisphaerales bacterium]